MKPFNPVAQVENSRLILDNGKWPNFHDAEVHYLNIWRGDIRPEDNIWVGPVIEMWFELCALENPYIAILKFHDCEAIKLQEFNHQNAIYDLKFNMQERGADLHGNTLTPFICVTFEQAFGMEFSFKCFRVEAIERRETNNAAKT